MNQSLTVVLPVHNAESTLRQSVERVLEVAGELTPDLRLLIIDDGSMDDSFDVAQEMAARYRQVRVIRQAQRRGLGPTINAVRRRVNADVVMVHDGVSKINAEQLRMLWGQRPGGDEVTMADLLLPRLNQAAMAEAHGRLMSFQLVDCGGEGVDEASTSAAPIPAPHKAPQEGVGGIPSLPRPNLAGAVGLFAKGE
ncbi:MAG: glycosyltransferase family 2 protein [Planctomycetota bacterium]